MTASEMATVLRVALPLVQLPEHRGKCLRLSVLGEGDAPGSEGETVWAEVRPDGTVHSCAEEPADPDGWGRGKVADWIPLLLDGSDGAVLVGADDQLVQDSLGLRQDPLDTEPSRRGARRRCYASVAAAATCSGWPGRETSDMTKREIQVREATVEDAASIARLLHDFNLEFTEPSPGVEALGKTVRRLLEAGEITALLAGEGPEGLSLLERTIEVARERGADGIDLNTGETDTAARALYESRVSPTPKAVPTVPRCSSTS